MLRLEYFFVSARMSVDRYSNRVSCTDILESVNPSVIPFAIPSLVIASCWLVPEAEVGKDFQSLIKIKSPAGRDLDPLATNFVAQGRRHRVFNRIAMFPVTEVGDHVFTLALNGVDCASHTLTIEIPKPEAIDENAIPIELQEAPGTSTDNDQLQPDS